MNRLCTMRWSSPRSSLAIHSIYLFIVVLMIIDFSLNLLIIIQIHIIIHPLLHFFIALVHKFENRWPLFSGPPVRIFTLFWRILVAWCFVHSFTLTTPNNSRAENQGSLVGLILKLVIHWTDHLWPVDSNFL